MANVLYDALFAPHLGKQTPFLIDANGQVTTHDAFLKIVARFAHAICAKDVQPGDRIVAQVAKSTEALALYAASVQSGAVFLPL
ncbi:MAG: malonyl-CoA synthase, partial [Hyphomicrobiales bacterium]